VRLVRVLIRALLIPLPWPIRRALLEKLFGYRLDRTARIGWSWFYPRMLEMGPESRIGHLNVAIHLERVVLEEAVVVSNGNWITGYPAGGGRHFLHCAGRKPELILKRHCSVAKNHHFDCTDRIEVGEYATVAGYNSQFLTHSINLKESRQDARPICIGNYTFVGTNVVILGGAHLPDYSALGAKSLLRTAEVREWSLYSGVPAVWTQDLERDCRYFSRTRGMID
jgi:acetyltransferase-like isoleucine patch superfamily enzyme